MEAADALPVGRGGAGVPRGPGGGVPCTIQVQQILDHTDGAGGSRLTRTAPKVSLVLVSVS